MTNRRGCVTSLPWQPGEIAGQKEIDKTKARRLIYNHQPSNYLLNMPSVPFTPDTIG